jgi:hypothetical protein
VRQSLFTIIGLIVRFRLVCSRAWKFQSVQTGTFKKMISRNRRIPAAECEMAQEKVPQAQRLSEVGDTNFKSLSGRLVLPGGPRSADNACTGTTRSAINRTRYGGLRL